MHMTATLTKWYEENGRHEIFAGGKSVGLTNLEHSLKLDENLVTKEVQHDLDELGIAKTAREEKLRAQREKLRAQQENERMAKLYREHILKEQASPDTKLVQLKTVKPTPEHQVTGAGFGD
jgi:hypothetical protein